MASHPTSVRFTQEDTDLLKRLQAHYGIRMLPVLQLAIRCLAREAGILPRTQSDQSQQS